MSLVRLPSSRVFSWTLEEFQCFTEVTTSQSLMYVFSYFFILANNALLLLPLLHFGLTPGFFSASKSILLLSLRWGSISFWFTLTRRCCLDGTNNRITASEERCATGMHLPVCHLNGFWQVPSWNETIRSANMFCSGSAGWLIIWLPPAVCPHREQLYLHQCCKPFGL